MKDSFILLVFILGSVVGALAHDVDIVRNCEDTGYTNSSIWTTSNLKCEVEDGEAN